MVSSRFIARTIFETVSISVEVFILNFSPKYWPKIGLRRVVFLVASRLLKAAVPAVSAIVPAKIAKSAGFKTTDNTSERKIQRTQKLFLGNAVFNYLYPKPSRQELNVQNV